MARIVYSDEERRARIQAVGDFILETGASTREAAKFFSENFFSISNATVFDYLERYKRMFPNKREELLNITKNNKANSIDDEETTKRVLINAKLMLENNLTVETLAEATNTSYWTIYRDLVVRLPKIDEELYNAIKVRLKQNSAESKKNTI